MILNGSQDLARLITAARKEKGWTQQQLADELFVSRKWVSEAERGKKHLDAHLLFQALIVLGYRVEVTPDDRVEDPMLEQLFSGFDDD